MCDGPSGACAPLNPNLVLSKLPGGIAAAVESLVIPTLQQNPDLELFWQAMRNAALLGALQSSLRQHEGSPGTRTPSFSLVRGTAA